MLDIDMRFKQGILFIRLNGILNGDTCMKLEESISTLIEDNGIKYVLFNLNNLDYIDKYGINLILKNYINITTKVRAKTRTNPKQTIPSANENVDVSSWK